MFIHTNTGTVSRVTKLLRDYAEGVWAFLSAAMSSLAGRGNKTDESLPSDLVNGLAVHS